MRKLINFYAVAFSVTVILCGETWSPMQLLSNSLIAACSYWLADRIVLEYKMQQFEVADAPIASQVARDLGIEVQA